MIHDLSNKQAYPSFHLYRTGEGINIYSKADIKPKDKVLVNGVELQLCVTKTLLGTARKSNYHDGRKRIKYYEFGIVA